MTTTPTTTPTASRPVGRPRDETVDAAILRATTDLLAEHGYWALTMESVAARAGVAKTTLYRRWSSKDELVLAALSHLKGPLLQPPGGSLREDLVFLLSDIRRGWSGDGHGRLMLRLALDGAAAPEHYDRIRTQVVAPRRAVLLAVLERGAREGEIDAGVNLDWVCDLLVAPIMSAGLTHQKPLSARQIGFVVDTVLRGVAARRP